MLVVNQAYFRGWHALVDGREQPPIRVDHALTGVVLAAGAHDVELEYRPASFTAGAELSGAALAALIVLLLWRRKRPDAPTAAEAPLSSSAARPPDRAPGTTAPAPDPRG